MLKVFATTMQTNTQENLTVQYVRMQQQLKHFPLIKAYKRQFNSVKPKSGF